jgi:hypothetical protein
MKEIQYISVQPEQTFELTRINITNVDDGKFLLLFQNPINLGVNASLSISASATADELLTGVKSFYANMPHIYSNIYTNLTWYDVNGTETLNQTESVMSVYYIQLRRLISTASASTITVVKTTSLATIVVDPPASVQLSA